MALHSKTEEMLKESIQEMLEGAALCIEYRKKDNGCLGYPALILLLIIADTIGSYYMGNKDYKIKIDEKEKYIDGNAFKYFYILNSEYYNLGLSEKRIKIIYENFRSLLIHNSVIAKNGLITLNDPLDRPFCFDDGFKDPKTGKNYPSVALIPLYRVTEFAIKNFLENIDDIFIKSKQSSVINKKYFDL